jgi:hypothetical protein
MNNLSLNWNSFDFKIAIVIFFAYILIDGMYAYYTVAVMKKNPITSATVGSLMHFLIAFGVLSYVENYLYLFPLALGSWIGTFLVVWKDSKTVVGK